MSAFPPSEELLDSVKEKAKQKETKDRDKDQKKMTGIGSNLKTRRKQPTHSIEFK
jgi:hypothetical protein